MTDAKTAGEKFLDVGPFGWLVRYQHSAHWLDFQAYEVASEDGDGGRLYLKKDWTSSGDMVSSLDEAEVTIDGHVKWDGCCEMSFGDHRPHFCGAGDVEEYTTVMRELHKLCLLLPEVEPDCAGYPTGPDP